jgi:hypothetical protein
VEQSVANGHNDDFAPLVVVSMLYKNANIIRVDSGCCGEVFFKRTVYKVHSINCRSTYDSASIEQEIRDLATTQLHAWHRTQSLIKSFSNPIK